MASLPLGEDDGHQQTMEKIIFAQEIERRKWASEIHDGIAQLLINIHYRIQTYRITRESEPTRAERDLDEIEGMVAESLAEARRLIDDLRPSILDDIGLIPAIEKYLRRMGNYLSVRLVVDNPIPNIPSPEETAIYRIIQEALTNVQRHAKASRVDVHLFSMGKVLVAEVTDDGQGFDIEAVNAEEDNWGLIGMQERAEVVGGSLDIKSTKGKGTVVHLEIPITISEAEDE